MENLEVKVKELNEENERLKGENTKLLTRIHTLEVEVRKKAKENELKRKTSI